MSLSVSKKNEYVSKMWALPSELIVTDTVSGTSVIALLEKGKTTTIKARARKHAESFSISILLKAPE